MTKAEAFYIEANAGKKTEKEIAEDLGLHIRTVQAYIKKLPPREEPSSEPVSKTKFAEDPERGVVCMTQAQAEADDESAGTSPFKDGERRPYNAEFYKTIQKNVHIIDPNKPIR